MKRISLFVFCVVAVAAAFFFTTRKSSAQSSLAERRITQAIDETKLVTLRGNTHPSARPEADQGAAPPDLAEDHMLLVLTPSAEQSAALFELLKEQQDPTSANYHKWISPDEFGQRFGVSEDDIATVSSWLGSHGFTIDQVPRGRTVIEFSGTAANIKEAFHTEIHKYFVHGEEHWANASDPQIPAALAPVVAGPASLNNFRRKPANRRLGTFAMNRRTHQARPLKAQFTFGTGCGLVGGDCVLVGPGDFDKIYSVPTAVTGGQGVNIGIVGDSRIVIADAQNFYQIFGIEGPGNQPRSLPNVTIATGGSDPGVDPSGDEGEADIDTQWSGAIAPAASINLVVSANTGASQGVDIAALSIVNAPAGSFQILSESFGTCEFSLGSAGNIMFGGQAAANVPAGSTGLWGQAASGGISVLVSAGDSGSAGCENPINEGEETPPQPAVSGLAVSGLSTPWNATAVGGTDFDQFGQIPTFWTASDTVNGNLLEISAKGPIPETTWNDSCTNTIYGLVGFSTSTQTNCNDTSVIPSFIVPAGGGGGPSSCAIVNGANCSGYTKPPYQTTLTSGLDNFRDVPDISLFAGTGIVNSFYPVCQQDQDPETPPNACNILPANGTNDIQGFGGTSVGTQAFAGIVGLLAQHKGVVAPGMGLGALNTRLYQLAGTPANVCTSSASPAAGCIFNDIVKGTNAQPCVLNSPDCSSTTTAIVLPPMRKAPRTPIFFVALACFAFIGLLALGFRLKQRNWGVAYALLVFALFLTCAACGGGGGGTVVVQNTNGILTGFNAGTGYDEATGLGSVNVQALINSF